MGGARRRECAAVLNEQELNQWAWDWAIRLKGLRTPDFFREGEQIAQKQKRPAHMFKRFFVWPVAAYYEYLAGNWSRQRAERQIKQQLTL